MFEDEASIFTFHIFKLASLIFIKSNCNALHLMSDTRFLEGHK